MPNSNSPSLMPKQAQINVMQKHYTILSLDESETTLGPADSSCTEIRIAQNLEQAHKLYGTDALEIRENLAYLDNFVRSCEDAFIGERFKTDARIATLLVEENYLSRGFHISEEPEHTILEMLQILAAQNKEDPFGTSTEDSFGQVRFVRLRRSRLRRILFNNPFLSRISTAQLNENQRWSEWQQLFNQANSDDKTDKSPALTDEDIDTLHKNFGDFGNFVKAVNLMRSWLIDHNSERQWSTMFLFPFGINALYNETNNKNVVKNNYFSGQGDVVYCMLQRAHLAQLNDASPDKTYVGAELIQRFFDKGDVVNTYAGYLSTYTQEPEDIATFNALVKHNSDKDGGHEAPSGTFATTFLPYKNLDAFTRLSDDFANILACDLNKQDLFIALSKIAILDLMIYLLEQEQKICICNEVALKAAEKTGLSVQFNEKESVLSEEELEEIRSKYNLSIPACAQDSDNKKLISLSTVRLLENSRLFNLSREAYARHRCHKYLELTVPFLNTKHTSKLTQEEASLVSNIIGAAFCYNPYAEKLKAEKKASNSRSRTPKKRFEWDDTNSDTIIESMVKKACTRDTHMDTLHVRMADYIGLSKGKGTAKSAMHYEISDDLLKVLVMAVLGSKEYMKLSEFIEILEERYHIVIYNTQKHEGNTRKNRRASAGSSDFEKNLMQFKLQLHRLDMLISLSDYCEYIKKA